MAVSPSPSSGTYEHEVAAPVANRSSSSFTSASRVFVPVGPAASPQPGAASSEEQEDLPRLPPRAVGHALLLLLLAPAMRWSGSTLAAGAQRRCCMPQPGPRQRRASIRLLSAPSVRLFV